MRKSSLLTPGKAASSDACPCSTRQGCGQGDRGAQTTRFVAPPFAADAIMEAADAAPPDLRSRRHSAQHDAVSLLHALSQDRRHDGRTELPGIISPGRHAASCPAYTSRAMSADHALPAGYEPPLSSGTGHRPFRPRSACGDPITVSSSYSPCCSTRIERSLSSSARSRPQREASAWIKENFSKPVSVSSQGYGPKGRRHWVRRRIFPVRQRSRKNRNHEGLRADCAPSPSSSARQPVCSSAREERLMRSLSMFMRARKAYKFSFASA